MYYSVSGILHLFFQVALSFPSHRRDIFSYHACTTFLVPLLVRRCPIIKRDLLIIFILLCYLSFLWIRVANGLLSFSIFLDCVLFSVVLFSALMTLNTCLLGKSHTITNSHNQRQIVYKVMNKAYTNWMLAVGSLNLVILLVTLLTSVFTSSPFTAVLWFFLPALVYFFCVSWSTIREDPSIVRSRGRFDVVVVADGVYSGGGVSGDVLSALLLLPDVEHGSSPPSPRLHCPRLFSCSFLGLRVLLVCGGSAIARGELSEGDGE